ncbi:MAG: hypothetical protein CVU44_07750 [Chloroflexi bacterium HGW-Chloroflexi-6]|nr:MAG: hypothetical protein CVU44_07750 [Chloroflexi bacterium HGW-Chloroflexi-6]
MTDNTRITHECALQDFNKALSAAMRSHIAEYKIGDIESSIKMCCETEAVQKKKGVFGGSEKALQGLILTEHWLIWAETVGGKATTAGSARLDQIDMRDYESTAMFGIIPDSGVNITGRYSDSNQTGQFFIGLDTSPAGKKFRELLREAIKNSKE